MIVPNNPNKGMHMTKKVKQEKRVPYRIIITGSYNKSSERTCRKFLQELEEHARNILDNMGLKEAGKDGVADYNDVRFSIEDPRDVIVSKWGVEDVLDRARNRKIKLSKETARKILYNLDHKMDAEIGINWDVIDCHTDMINDINYNPIKRA
jgi:hypothetical protein